MTEENMEIRENKCNRICHSKDFRIFLTIALGSFVGVFCALSLFAALHKPPMMIPHCPCKGRMMPPPMVQCHHFNRWDKGTRGEFHKNFDKNQFSEKTPVRINVEK